MDSARKDDAHITAEWQYRRACISDVRVRDVNNVVTANGITTEVYRTDWNVLDGAIQQVIHVALRGSAVSAWHQHPRRTARRVRSTARSPPPTRPPNRVHDDDLEVPVGLRRGRCQRFVEKARRRCTRR
jgi:hypothetical protein